MVELSGRSTATTCFGRVILLSLPPYCFSLGGSLKPSIIVKLIFILSTSGRKITGSNLGKE